MMQRYRANPLYPFLSFVLPSILVGFLLRNDIASGAPFDQAELVMLSLFMLPWLFLVAYLLVDNAEPFGCEISVNGPFTGTLPRNTFRQPGLFYQDTAILKNFSLPWHGMQVQLRAEFYNVFNHPNLYVNSGTADISTPSFTNSAGLYVPGVTAGFSDNREIVLALKVLF
jgi:hypothetical protein